MAMVMFMTHCAVLQGNNPFYIVEKTKAKSRITCAVKCNFFKDRFADMYFGYEPTLKDKNNSKVKSHEKEHTKVKTKRLKGSSHSGICYCVSLEKQHALTFHFNNSRVCFLNTASREDKTGEKPGTLTKNKVKYDKPKSAYDDVCVRTTGCKGRDVYCVRRRCRCKKGHHYSKLQKKCKKNKKHKSAYGSACKISKNCRGREVVCLRRKCRCKKGHHYNDRQNRCEIVKRIKIGQRCTENSDCNGKLHVCVVGRCFCKPEYLPVAWTYRCTRDCGKFVGATTYPNLRMKGHPAIRRFSFLRSMTYTQSLNSCIHKCSEPEDEMIMCMFAHLKFVSNHFECYVSSSFGIEKLQFYSRRESKAFTFLILNCDQNESEDYPFDIESGNKVRQFLKGRVKTGRQASIFGTEETAYGLFK